MRRRMWRAMLAAVIALAAGGCEFVPTVAGGTRGHVGRPDGVRCLLPERELCGRGGGR